MAAVSNTVARLITGKYAIFVRLGEILKIVHIFCHILKNRQMWEDTHQLQDDANFQGGGRGRRWEESLQVPL